QEKDERAHSYSADCHLFGSAAVPFHSCDCGGQFHRISKAASSFHRLFFARAQIFNCRWTCDSVWPPDRHHRQVSGLSMVYGWIYGAVRNRKRDFGHALGSYQQVARASGQQLYIADRKVYAAVPALRLLAAAETTCLLLSPCLCAMCRTRAISFSFSGRRRTSNPPRFRTSAHKLESRRSEITISDGGH